MSIVPAEETAEAKERVRQRRRWSKEAKRRIVAETLAPGASVSIVARRHDVNANQVFTWRRQLREGRLGGEEPRVFVPVLVPPEAPSSAPSVSEREAATPPESGPRATSAASTGRMEIVLGRGRRIIVDEMVNAEALGRVIEVLERR